MDEDDDSQTLLANLPKSTALCPLYLPPLSQIRHRKMVISKHQFEGLRQCCNRILFVFIVAISSSSALKCRAFAPPILSRHPPSITSRNTPLHTRTQSSSTQLYSNNRNAFDISKPTFDLFSFRMIRSDALLRYNSLNQSEPLRINLFLLATVSLLGYPLWCESVTGDVATSLSTAGAIGAGVGSAALFWRERSKRSRQLKRMEKELNAESLEVRLPVRKSISSVRPISTLKQLKGKRRIVAVRGTKEQFIASGITDTLCVLRRRLVQSQTLVVLVPTDGSKREDWGLKEELIGDALWLGDPTIVDGEGGWLQYFRELLESDEGDTDKKSNELAWFALNFKGRSIASGMAEPPKLLELLGQQLQPMEILDETDAAESSADSSASAVEQILECQKQFYVVLTASNDESKMKTLFEDTPAAEVDEVLTGGGRIDDWSKCLERGARPEGMVISGSDVWISSNTLAYSTCIEFPWNAGIDGATLLAVQRWGRESEGADWKLELHQTIPWATGSRAGGTLRCDCRGCVALARTHDRRTFGGIIG